jgi:CheY-like chemotaxis protein
MPKKIKDGSSKDTLAIHKFYMEILNCVPDIVYWVDINCALKGCNSAFVKWIGLKRMEDFAGTPYEQMAKFEKCTEQRIETFKLDDMAVLFSGEAKYNVEEIPVYEIDTESDPTYYLANRVPLFNDDKQVTGVVVVLKDITAQRKAEKSQPIVSTANQPRPVSTLKDTPNVLMVEDNVIAQKVEEALLTALHCQVDIADSGDKAVLLFDPGKYDIVFMDIGLQDTSGYLVAKKIRQKEENTQHHVPIIALTSYQADVVQYDCDEYFMDGVLTKPLTSEQANQIIQHYIYHEDIPVAGLKSSKNKEH